MASRTWSSLVEPVTPRRDRPRRRRGVPFGVGAGVAVLALVAGCAQPGQLGHPPIPEPAPVAAPVAAPQAPVAPPGPVAALLGSGRLPERVTLRTQGPAQVVVRTEVLEPGRSTGWHRHPGTETAVLISGSVQLQRDGACEPVTLEPGDAAFVPDAEPHQLRNTGDTVAELVVTRLLAPGAPEQEPAESDC